MKHGLAPSDVFCKWPHYAQVVSELRKADQGGFSDAALDQVSAATPAKLVKSRSFESLLKIHFVIDDVGNKLRLGHRLIPPAHDAEPDMKVPLLHESRNDRMERPLVGSKCVRAARSQRESSGTILQNNAVFAHCHSRTECAGEALDQRN